MRPLRVVLLVALFPLSTFAADRYWIATRSAPRVAPLRLLQDSDESRRHAVHAFESVDAFAADLNIDEVVSLKRSPDVRYVSPLVPRYASGDDSRPPLSAFAYIPASNLTTARPPSSRRPGAPAGDSYDRIDRRSPPSA